MLRTGEGLDDLNKAESLVHKYLCGQMGDVENSTCALVRG